LSTRYAILAAAYLLGLAIVLACFVILALKISRLEHGLTELEALRTRLPSDEPAGRAMDSDQAASAGTSSPASEQPAGVSPR
jgi:hypothetical protein